MKGSTLLIISALALVHADPTRFFENGCPKDRSKLLPHQDCGRFFVCFGETKFVRECPSGLHFNSKLEVCDFPQNVKCKSIQHEDSKVLKKREINVPDVIIEVDKSDPSRAPIICATENSDGVLVAHENCNQFYKCYDGEPVALDCPGNLLYNIEEEYCDWPSNVVCGQRVVPEGKDDEDNNSGECDNNADPSEACKICAADDSDGVLVAHENCNQFYKCFNGKPVALNCPNDLLYNIEEEYCDWPSNVVCGERVIPEGNDNEDNNDGNYGDNNCNDEEDAPSAGNNADPSEAPKICAADDSDGVLVAHENCNQFYKCFGGEPVALDCPSNLLFNPEKDYCDWRFNVNCGDRIIPEGSSDENDNSLANHLCSGKDDDIVFAHENCNQFYKCVDTHMEPMYCPEGLYFNNELKVCDWPTSVDCGQRLK